MKRFLAILCMVLLQVGLVNEVYGSEIDLSTFELPQPVAPNYFVYEAGEGEESHDYMEMIMLVDTPVAMLAMEYYNDSDSFYEKYQLYHFNIVMQYDVSLDNEENWQYTSEWDCECYVGGYGDGYQSVSLNGNIIDEFEFFWLVYHEENGETFIPYQPAIVSKHHKSDDYEWNTYHFDTKNHSLYIRCRYYMEWETYDKDTNTIGERQSKVSDWSESAIFGKNTTQKIPETPTTYEAPILSDLHIEPLYEDTTSSYIIYEQITPQSVWDAGIYYLMTDDGSFDGLETQISINGGEWTEFETANSWSDWCLHNGTRFTYYDSETVIEDGDNVKIRARFTGTHGPSKWSNIIEINGNGGEVGSTETNGEKESETLTEQQPTVDNDNPTTPSDKCTLCGFCPVPLGLCIFIWIAIVLVGMIVVIVIIILATKKKKCPKCKEPYQKGDKFCKKCGHNLK